MGSVNKSVRLSASSPSHCFLNAHLKLAVERVIGLDKNFYVPGIFRTGNFFVQEIFYHKYLIEILNLNELDSM